MAITGVVNNQQIQTSNKFAMLEVQDDDEENNNQLVIVEGSVEPSSPTTNLNAGGRLNPKATVFTPKYTGVRSTSRKGKAGNITGNESAIVEGVQKESTTAWVNSAFAGNPVTTNQSCQEIPSQATDIDAALKESNVNERLQLSGGKLWSQQVEEDPEEGELSRTINLLLVRYFMLKVVII